MCNMQRLQFKIGLFCSFVHVSVLLLLICYTVKLINNALINVCLFRCSQGCHNLPQSLITTVLCKLPYMQRIVSLSFVRQYNIFNLLQMGFIIIFKKIEKFKPSCLFLYSKY